MKKDETITLRLSEISGYHPSVSEFVAQLADRNFTTSISQISQTAAEQFLRIHPICVSQYRGKFFVIAGFRSFQIAELTLQQNTLIKCLAVAAKQNIVDIAKTDILFSPLVFSLSTKVTQQTKKLISIVGADFTNEHHSDLASERSLARAHGRSP